MDTSNLPKVIRNGKVAVLYSPGFGAGWYSWNRNTPACLFDPEIVALVESEKSDVLSTSTIKKISDLAEEKYSPRHSRDTTSEKGFYAGGADWLSIEWVTQGHGFEISEYDGSESVRIVGEIDFIIA
jgi:hypothetical protein